MKIKTKYVFEEFFINFCFSFLIILFIFIVRSIFQLVDLIIKGSFSLFPLLKFFLFSTIISFQIVIPLTVLASSVSLFSTFSSDRELNIFLFSGIPSSVLIKPLFLFSIIFTFFLFYFNFFTVPKLEFKRREITHFLKIKNPLSLIIEKEIIKEFPDITIYIEKVYRRFYFKNISITKREGGNTIFLKAEKGKVKYLVNENKLLFSLENGNLLVATADSISSVEFKNYNFYIDLPEKFRTTEIKPQIYELDFFQLKKVKNLEGEIEFHKRIIYSITPMVLILLGSGIGMNLKQKNKILYIGIGGFISIIFFELLTLGEIISRKTEKTLFIYLPIYVFILLTKKFWKK
ncbi:MAG: LptF/LptG family permease [Candidatus Omnitrophica bacterium]|nr:LptF/LptG family permease [Candidatus Omnitrophota bacterium]MCM8807801.1 LptF/LptG family permease [Candidatus Omnitrophota bacterium]